MGKFKDFLNEGKVTVKKRDLIATKDIIKGLYKDNKITEVSVDIIVDAFTQEQYNKEWVAEVMPNIALILKGKSIPSYNTIIKSLFLTVTLPSFKKSLNFPISVFLFFSYFIYKSF